ncbi:hypothetical protein [Thiomicrorhabdus aquaedulcis]|uniref:hypothetical protein n=1 Tax=Thiomicrorhabdus aquaedulcis TaxID=2211106 RepID=UPI000FD981B4|nr:hypothetical protein [Thiomicrorhabdus aquaedulcis]
MRLQTILKPQEMPGLVGLQMRHCGLDPQSKARGKDAVSWHGMTMGFCMAPFIADPIYWF